MSSNNYDDYEERSQRRREEYRQMRIEKERQKRMQQQLMRYGIIGAFALVVLVVVVIIIVAIGKGKGDKKPDASKVDSTPVETAAVATPSPIPTPTPIPEDPYVWEWDGKILKAEADSSTGGVPGEATCEYAILVDVEAGKIICQKEPRTRINPASMTKILTVLVAAEHIKDLDDTFTITRDITDYCFVNDCSNVGYNVGAKVPVRDLFYGTIMPSGADAALGLAEYVAGSQEAFVDLMNDKLKDLGISETTHFTNCIGLYDANHYSTCYDMAVILKAAADSPFVREVLSAHTFDTTPVENEDPEKNQEAIPLSNLFLRRIEDYDTNADVLCAKTGYVLQSKNCAASLAKDINGKEYICVTAGSAGAWKCIYDHRDIYKKYLPEMKKDNS